MSSESWDELIVIPENENIMFSDNTVRIHPEAMVAKTFTGTLIITDKRIIVLRNKEKGLINKTFAGYDKLEYNVYYSEINRIEVSQTLINALKFLSKTDRGADEKPLLGISVKDSTIYSQIYDAISIQKPIKTKEDLREEKARFSTGNTNLYRILGSLASIGSIFTGYSMTNIRSIGGQTVAEYYYQQMGYFVMGLSVFLWILIFAICDLIDHNVLRERGAKP